MMYKVVKAFTDLQDNNHVYLAGDIYPRGAEVSEERVAELASANNKRGEVLIKAIEEAPKPVKTKKKGKEKK